MKRKKKTVSVLADEGCFICGESWVIHTTCPQECDEGCDPDVGHSFHAYDGDRVTCPDCKATAWVSVDGEDAYIAYDEMTPHNIRCAEKYEKAQEAKP